MDIILAVIIGFSFGFILQKIGASNPERIIGMLRLKDFHLMKVILLAIGISNLILFSLLSLGLLDVSHISVKSSYVGVLIGGGIMGLGWAISGFCPGTGIVALGEGRKDALFFVLGGMLGALILTLIYGAIKDSFLYIDLGGKMTLAATNAKDTTTLLTNISGVLTAGIIGFIFIGVALSLPSKTTDK